MTTRFKALKERKRGMTRRKIKQVWETPGLALGQPFGPFIPALVPLCCLLCTQHPALPKDHGQPSTLQHAPSLTAPPPPGSSAHLLQPCLWFPPPLHGCKPYRPPVHVSPLWSIYHTHSHRATAKTREVLAKDCSISQFPLPLPALKERELQEFPS